MPFPSLPQRPKDNKKKPLFNLKFEKIFFRKPPTSSSSFTGAAAPSLAGPDEAKNIPISEAPRIAVENEDINRHLQVSAANAGKQRCTSER
jgi:hypothetical protein